LYLQGNRIGNEGADLLARELLTSNKTMQTVFLFDNILTDSKKEELRLTCGTRMTTQNALM